MTSVFYEETFGSHFLQGFFKFAHFDAGISRTDFIDSAFKVRFLYASAFAEV
jgi:hypothetical protein